ncbi:M20 aminoacylase family protein [Enterovirga aerilata]|uniref:Amidohydrolase n=1 Tax=Enterovirga aerilata TaxID=2730920 RepID=A0A849I1T5_9HYPH|nr:M20 aminoacylase family protein [Enterovirga sp. DB1703]NNM71321.1 amidohydrolase [Enterovirga sp. DB1703]
MTHPLLAEIAPFADDLIRIRRDIHAHPETSFEETRTAALVAERLRSWGIEVSEGVGRTGVVGTLRGRRPGNHAVGLRADMDALNIHEQTGLPYASTIPGKMHACGHDGHTTMLLGAARYLAEKPDFAGQVHFIFQPAEEGGGGAARMIEDGLFERFPCDAVYGMHNGAGTPVGQFRLRPGPMMAAVDFFTVTFRGTGGHGGSTPHLATDTTIAQAHFVLALQNVIGRNIPALEPAVISIGSIQGGSPHSPNVIPAEIAIRGTVRTFSEDIRAKVERRMRELAEAHAAAQGCTAEVVYEKLCQALVNHPEQTAIATRVAASLVGGDRVEGNAPPITGGEDFSDMLRARPGAFIFIGNGVNPDGTHHPVHTPHYDFNDGIIPLGVAYWVSLVREELAAP